MNLALYLIRETPKARLFAYKPGGWPTVWIPRSVTFYLRKQPIEKSGSNFQLCYATVADWWCRQNGIEAD